MAVANYHDFYGCYPPAYLADAEGRPQHSWRVLLLPFLEQQALYERYNFAEPWNGSNNRKLAAQMPEIYALHGEYRPGRTTTNYLAVVGPETAWPGSTSRLTDEVTDGMASTILVVENVGADVHWMEPRDLTFATMGFALDGDNGVSSKYADPAVAMLDGSLHRLHPNLPAQVLRALLTVAGGDDVKQHEGRWTLLRDGRDRPLTRAPEP